MKKVKFVALVLAFASMFSLVCGVNAQVEELVYVPLWMQPQTIIVYDEELDYTVIQGGELTEEDIAGRADIAAVGLTSTDDDMLASPNIRVEYDQHGFVQNIYYPASDNAGEYQLSPPGKARVRSGIIGAGEFYTSTSTYYNYDTQKNQYCTFARSTDGKRMTAVGRITFYTGNKGEGGTHTLQAYDCATKMYVDDVAAGTPVLAKNQYNGKQQTYYKYDVGGLPSAILDIWSDSTTNPITDITNNGTVDNVYSGAINHEVIEYT